MADRFPGPLHLTSEQVTALAALLTALALLVTALANLRRSRSTQSSGAERHHKQHSTTGTPTKRTGRKP